MPDVNVASAIAHWGPRFVQAGVDYNDFLRTTVGIERWEQWLGVWEALGDVHAAAAREAESTGHRVSAGEAWLRAAQAYHFAKFVWVLDESRSRPVHDKSVAAYYAGHRLLGTGLERIEVRLDGTRIVGNLRLPSGGGKSPLVLLLPGLDSTKEELFQTENCLLLRGMATFSLDGPGQGESAYALPIRPDYETASMPVLNLLLARPEIDADRVAVFGVSMGGYYAPRAAVFDRRIRAVVALSGPYQIITTWEIMAERTRQVFRVKSHSASDEETRAKLAKFDLEGVINRLEQPALFVTGDADVLVPWQETERQAAHAPNGRFVNYPGGNHGVCNYAYWWRPFVADWIRDRLG